MVTTIGGGRYLRVREDDGGYIALDLGTIGEYAFRGCGQLREVDLSKTKVTTMGLGAFYNCPLLQSVTLPTHHHSGLLRFRLL